MEIEERLQLLEEYCFNQNNAFQNDSFDSVVAKLQSGEGLGFGAYLSPDIPALLAIFSTTKGLLFPNMTETQRDAITKPRSGLVIYNTDSQKLNLYTTAWEEITSA